MTAVAGESDASVIMTEWAFSRDSRYASVRGMENFRTSPIWGHRVKR